MRQGCPNPCQLDACFYLQVFPPSASEVLWEKVLLRDFRSQELTVKQRPSGMEVTPHKAANKGESSISTFIYSPLFSLVKDQTE